MNRISTTIAETSPNVEKISSPHPFAAKMPPVLSISPPSVTVVTTFNLGGQTIDRYVELIFLRDEQVRSELQLSNVNEPFPEDLIEPIVTRTQERMAALAEA